MTPYRFDNQKQKLTFSRKKIAGVVLGVGALSAIIIFVIAPFIQKISEGPLWLHDALVQGSGEVIDRLTPKKILLQKYRALEEKMQTYEIQLLELEIARDENAKLRDALSYSENPNEIILAAVIAKPSQSLYNSMIIDRGSDDGIVVGQLVTVQGTVGLGTIASVTPTTATVALFSGPQFNEELVIKYQNITVPAKGRGGGNFEIHIPREIEVSDGDVLVFPYDQTIAVGIIKSIEFDPRDPFQTILARVPVNVQELRFVEVVR